jgi:hypothetical protein
MKKPNKKHDSDLEMEAMNEASDLIPIPFPFFRPVSGLYKWSLLIQPNPLPIPIPTPIPIPNPNPTGFEEESFQFQPEAAAQIIPPILLRSEQLRVDVDGRYPQMQISGTLFRGLTQRVHWIANVTKTAPNQWSGGIWYKDGDAAALPSTQIVANITPSFFPAQRIAKITFMGGGVAGFTRVYNFVSPYFHEVEFEFDSATGVTAVTQINTGDHPNRPASLPVENLPITTVYQRAGFDVKMSGNPSVVPLAGAVGGANPNWSDSEMHDAMQTYWSRFANKAQWSMWTFFAALHEQGTSLGGIMFDDIGPNHRQGTAMFNNAFISQAPAGDPNPVAWVKRMKFWTACHEMGHAFNLAHSWQKQHPPAWGTPWIPLANEPLARSFMNYPYNVPGGQTSFFSDFAFRFSDQELKFLRHAPSRFVQMGNADWFDNHGFQQANTLSEPTFKLEVRANRQKSIFEFLEPVVLELKLTNVSNQPQIIDENLLTASDDLTVIIKKQNREARQWSPFAQYCFNPAKTVLNANDSAYESLFVAAGKNGWDVAEPGNYTIQVALHLEDEDIVSAPYNLRIAPPRGYEEEYLAQDFFSEDVGRILAFDGSQYLTGGNDTLREASDRFAERAVAVHAQVALGSPMGRDYKLLTVPDGSSEMASVADANGKIAIIKAQENKADKELSSALLEDADKSAETLGHIDYRYYVDQLSEIEATQGDNKEAAKSQGVLLETLTKRGVLPRVLEEIDDRQNVYVPTRSKTAKSKS